MSQTQNELVALRSTISQAQILVDSTQKVAIEAQTASESAARRADLAQTALQGEQDLLAQVVSAAYRQGSGGDLEGLLTSPDTDPTLYLSTLVYMDRITQGQNQKIHEALAALTAANEAQAQAQYASNQATVAATTALDAQAALLKNQSDLQAKLVALFSMTSQPQTSIGPDGCPTTVPTGTLREGSDTLGVAQLCADSVAQASTPQAAVAIKAALSWLGAPYACGGVGRSDPYRFDCSSYVSRAYEAAGLNTAGANWAPSTRDLIPWDGVKLAPWATYVAPQDARPGDLVLYRSCTTSPCAYQHVVMLLADGYMTHTNACGDVAHVQKFYGFGKDHNFIVVRRVDPSKA